MRNQTTKSHNAKSKIFITLLCIFGLLFSYSCQCKNNVSDPNNIPDDNGIKTNDITTDTGDTDPDKDLVDGALSTTSTKVIVVAGAGDTVKTTSTIKFKNATATLTAIADVDASANTPTDLTLDDFDYTGTTLTFKKDTTDASKYDATTLAKVNWSGESKKITATFTLMPAENVTLSETEKTVVIEIVKIKVLKSEEVYTEALKKIGGGSMSVTGSVGTAPFIFTSGTGSKDTFKVATVGDADIGTVKLSDFKTTFNTDTATRAFDNFSKIEIIDEGSFSGTVATFTLQFTLKDEIKNNQYYEFELGDGTYKLEADIKSNYDNNQNTVKWE